MPVAFLKCRARGTSGGVGAATETEGLCTTYFFASIPCSLRLRLSSFMYKTVNLHEYNNILSAKALCVTHSHPHLEVKSIYISMISVDTGHHKRASKCTGVIDHQCTSSSHTSRRPSVLTPAVNIGHPLGANHELYQDAVHFVLQCTTKCTSTHRLTN